MIDRNQIGMIIERIGIGISGSIVLIYELMLLDLTVRKAGLSMIALGLISLVFLTAIAIVFIAKATEKPVPDKRRWVAFPAAIFMMINGLGMVLTYLFIPVVLNGLGVPLTISIGITISFSAFFGIVLIIMGKEVDRNYP